MGSGRGGGEDVSLVKTVSRKTEKEELEEQSDVTRLPFANTIFQMSLIVNVYLVRLNNKHNNSAKIKYKESL